MNLIFRPKAWEQFLFWQETDKATVKKINGLIKECQRHPFEGTGKPEPLKRLDTDGWGRDSEKRIIRIYHTTELNRRVLAEEVSDYIEGDRTRSTPVRVGRE